MEPKKHINGNYINSVCLYLKGLTPGTKVDISRISKNPDAFVQAVKVIIDLRIIDVELSADFKHVKRMEDINYDRYKRKG